jgi:hypothetical protein
MLLLLQAWAPPDPSAHALLLPWKQVWRPAEWKDITNRTVVPALEAAMHHILNLFPHPIEQFNVSPCEWCFAWTELLSTKQLAGSCLLACDAVPIQFAFFAPAASTPCACLLANKQDVKCSHHCRCL